MGQQLAFVRANCFDMNFDLNDPVSDVHRTFSSLKSAIQYFPILMNSFPYKLCLKINWVTDMMCFKGIQRRTNNYVHYNSCSFFFYFKNGYCLTLFPLVKKIETTAVTALLWHMVQRHLRDFNLLFFLRSSLSRLNCKLEMVSKFKLECCFASLKVFTF